MNRNFFIMLFIISNLCFPLFAGLADTFDQGDRVRAAVFSPDGNYIAAVGDSGVIKMWAAWGKNNGVPVKIFTGHTGNVNTLAFSPDGNNILSGGDDKMIYLWEVNGANTLPARSFYRLNILKADKLRSVLFMPDGRHIATAGEQKEINIWEISGGSITKTIGWDGNASATGISASPNEKLIAAAMDDGTARIFATGSDAKPMVLSSTAAALTSVRFSPDGRFLAAGSFDSNVYIWNTASGKLVKTLAGHKARVNSVAFSRDGKYLVSAGSDKKVVIWSNPGPEAAFQKSVTGHDGSVNSAEFALDSAYVAAAGDDKTIKLWNVSAAAVDPAQQGAAGGKKSDGKKPPVKAAVEFTRENPVIMIMGAVILVLLFMLLTMPKQQIPNIIHPKLSEDRDIYLKNRCVGLDIRGFTKADAETQKIWAKQLNSTLDKVLHRFHGYLLILIGDGALVCFLGTMQNPDVHIDFALQFLEEASKYGFRVKMAISEGDDLLKNVVIDGQKSVNCYGNSITRAARLLARGDSAHDEIIIDKIAYDLYFCNAGSYRDKIAKDPAANKAMVYEATRKHEEELELTYVLYKIPVKQAGK